jgi:hypothetical protein
MMWHNLTTLCKQLWRVSENQFQFRTLQGQFLSSADNNGLIMVNADTPGVAETFLIERSGSKIHIKPINGSYIQVKNTVA